MLIADKWKEYKVIKTGNMKKLEQWGNKILLRPDPQVIWKREKNYFDNEKINAKYTRSSEGGGYWEGEKINDFVISYNDLKFKLKLMGFKHTGLFPEQAVNWDRMTDIINNSKRKPRVLNLFAYTGGATVACAKAGAVVCHVDSAKAMVERAHENADLSKVDSKNTRYIVDDCFKFCEKEIRRNHKYDAIILDPPSYGRGPNNELWKIEDSISDLINLVSKLISDDPLFVCLNSYTTGLQPTVMANLLNIYFNGYKKIEADEIGIPTEEGLILPQGCTAFARY